MYSTRLKLAWITGLLFLAAAVGYWTESHDGGHQISGAALKVGVVMFFFWLAYPQLATLPRFLAITLAGAALVVLFLSPGQMTANLRALTIVGPLLLLFFFLGRARPIQKK